MGHVYLIEDISNRTYKIGASRQKTGKRIKSLQTGNSTELKIKFTFDTEYPFRLESMLHTRFKDYLILNEWYDLPKNIIESFDKTCEELNNIILSLKDNPYFSKGLK